MVNIIGDVGSKKPSKWRQQTNQAIDSIAPSLRNDQPWLIIIKACGPSKDERAQVEGCGFEPPAISWAFADSFSSSSILSSNFH